MNKGPNVLLIVADDMGYGDFGAFGNELIRTPNLDRLAREGMCLTQHYAGSPVCSPSRAALLTGRYPHRTGAITPQETRGLDRISPREVTLGDAFKHGGYSTGLIGKWHNGALDPAHHPNARGFDEFAGFRGGWADYYRWRLDVNGSFRPTDGRYLTDVLTEEALSFIARHEADPFLLALMYNAPHSPLQAPEPEVARYEALGLPRGVALTYAMIEVMDRGIGRVLDEVDRRGLRENTLVMFSSDNGPAFRLRDDQVPEGVSVDTTRFNSGFSGCKAQVLEGGIRVPMLLRWTGGLPGGGLRVGNMVHFCDWLPTLLEAAGIERPGGLPLDGQSVLGQLRGEESRPSPARFWQWNMYQPIGETNAAMRDGDWKLVRPVLDIGYRTAEDEAAMQRYVETDIEYKYHPENVTRLMDDPDPELVVPDPPPPQLYNIAADPFEGNDLAAEHPDRAARMNGRLQDWFGAVDEERARAHELTLGDGAG